MILTAFWLLMIGSSASSVVAAMDSNRRAKRIAFGEPLPSLDTYRMYFFVQLRRSWACVTDQTEHEDSLTRCQEDYHQCGGTLIHPEFVLTAAHCLMYFEVVVYEKFTGDESWVQDKTDLIYYSLKEAWEEFKHAIVGIFVVPKPRHTVYSDYALFMGSHDQYYMTQKRHVVKVIPHSIFPLDIRSDDALDYFDRTLNEWHDVALLQTCEPFKIKLGEVELAPMLRTTEQLREQYERIVKLSMVCLYVGFGDQDNESEEARKSGYPIYPENFMLHTWRKSICNSFCSSSYVENPAREHTCILCSRHHGNKLGTPEAGDSGSPVTCEGKFVATYTKGSVTLSRNASRSDSYPVHCIWHTINNDRLNEYKKLPHGGYHPLSGSRLRRLPLPTE